MKRKLLVASLLVVVRPGAPSSVLAPSSDALITMNTITSEMFFTSSLGKHDMMTLKGDPCPLPSY